MIFKKVDGEKVQIGKAEVDSDTNEEAIRLLQKLCQEITGTMLVVLDSL